MNLDEIIEGFRRGERRALSRAISLVEREGPGHERLFDSLFPARGQAARIGVTGPVGAGKSTLLAQLVRYLRQDAETVGIVAVDPSSPLTGGALLGDRVRLTEHTLDEGVFIRSMATRGAPGGLAMRSVEVADLLDAFRFDRILIETVGVGQVESDILEAADLVVVVLHPGGGDAIQAMKAGLLELADVFVLNKADIRGIDQLEAELTEMQTLRHEEEREVVGMVKTVATTGEGVPDLVAAIDGALERLRRDGRLDARRRRRHVAQVRRILEASLRESLWGPDGMTGRAVSLMDAEGSMPPYAQAARLLGELHGALDRTGTAGASKGVPGGEGVPDE